MTYSFDDIITKLSKIDPESVGALAEIATERLRQIENEGWLPSHDDKYTTGTLAKAGGAYALNLSPEPPSYWPWDVYWWKPKTLQRNCIKAAALLIAEIAREARKI